jgi:hypothetical protein
MELPKMMKHNTIPAMVKIMKCLPNLEIPIIGQKLKVTKHQPNLTIQGLGLKQRMLSALSDFLASNNVK